MIKGCENGQLLIQYIKEKVYSGINEAMWDRHLWFYNKLTSFLDIPFVRPEDRCENLSFFLIEDNGEARGVICREIKKEEITYYIYGSDNFEIKSFLERELKNRSEKICISTVNEDLYNFIKTEYLCNLKEGIVKFYKDSFEDTEVGQGIKVSYKEVEEYKEIAYLRIPIEHLNYFGYLIDNRIVSTCGIAPISNVKAEVIGVNTYNLEDRKKGYAKSVCRFAINAMKQDYKIFTWKTDITNHESIELSKLLGFKEYQREYKVNLF